MIWYVYYYDKTLKNGHCFTFNESSFEHRLGRTQGLNILINYDHPGFDINEPVSIILHESIEQPDINNVMGKNFFAAPGHIIDLKFSATVIDTTEDFDAMTFESRLCDNNIASGEVDCIAKQIFEKAKLDCKCQPFYINSSGNMICDTMGAYCFEEALQNGTENLDLRQNCYKACKRIQYGLGLSADLPITDILSKFDMYGDVFADYFFNISNLYGFLGDPSDQNQFLEPKLKRKSLISINFEGPEVLTVTKDAKITVPDMIGNIGGTLGVFVGFSFIGLLDYLIEFVQYLDRRLRRNG